MTLLKIVSIVCYELGQGEVQYVAIANRDYRKHDNDFYNDRRQIPMNWAVMAKAAWIKRGEPWFSAPFDGVWDFNLVGRENDQ